MNIVYRYEEHCYSLGLDECDEPIRGIPDVKIHLEKYDVVKETPCGIWIQLNSYTRKFINLKANKKFACLTKEDAIKSFILRKKSQVRILSNQLEIAQIALSKGVWIDKGVAPDYE